MFKPTVYTMMKRFSCLVLPPWTCCVRKCLLFSVQQSNVYQWNHLQHGKLYKQTPIVVCVSYRGRRTVKSTSLGWKWVVTMCRRWNLRWLFCKCIKIIIFILWTSS